MIGKTYQTHSYYRQRQEIKKKFPIFVGYYNDKRIKIIIPYINGKEI